ncbi:Rrf2 family transcriptional regulator [Pseudoramibacter faecis]|uniref:RrF2 family transcriptional regulator n=1 Tax=Pseudoramibacter faecis TaxID=3108534 RepID=UPI002E788CCA|nr:Rrf2 family transcriptional regulator [Pseudoramibacter sp. HA2172]
MRISAKGRYGIASMIELSWMSREGHHVPVATLAENLGISKIYLEQIFSLLKRGGLVASIKGAQGGYHLAKSASKINVYEILKALEQILFEPTESSVDEKSPAIESVMQEGVFRPLDTAIKTLLVKIRLSDLLEDYINQKNQNNFMFYI